jgi:hypothetical protein
MRNRLSASEIATDRTVLKAIENLVDYQSVNPACSLQALQQLDATLRAAEDASEQARQAYERAALVYAQAREVELTTAQMLHDSLGTAKSQVRAQYGADSYAVKAIGWTRRSDRKRPARKASAS